MIKSFKLGTQLNIAFFVALFVPLALATIYSIVYYSNKIQQEALHTVSANLKVAALIYDNKVAEMEKVAITYAKRKTVVLFFHMFLNEKLGKDLEQAASSDKVDMVTLVDTEYKVVSRSHIPKQFGDVIPRNLFIDMSLTGKAVSGTEDLSFEDLNRESGKISPQPDNQETSSGFLALTAAAPVYDREEKNIIGAVILRRILNSEKEITGQISGAMEADAAIFNGESLIAGNLREKDRNHLEHLSHSIREAVFGQGLFFEEADIRKGGHLTKYQPLSDADGKPVGAMMVRIDASRYAKTQADSHYYAVSHFSHRLSPGVQHQTDYPAAYSGPVERLKRGTERIAEGDYSYQLKVTSQDEIGLLAQAFNKMAVQLRESLTELEKNLRKQERLKREMELAQKIQTSLLPQKTEYEELDIEAIMIPADEVGGDFYDMLNGHGASVSGSVSETCQVMV